MLDKPIAPTRLQLLRLFAGSPGWQLACELWLGPIGFGANRAFEILDSSESRDMAGHRKGGKLARVLSCRTLKALGNCWIVWIVMGS